MQKILGGSRPDRPTTGFSNPLWALLTQMWLEEYESSPPTRPNITVVLKQLEDEAKTWNPIVRKASCTSSTPSESNYA
jgi:hypothetical protein